MQVSKDGIAALVADLQRTAGMPPPPAPPLPPTGGDGTPRDMEPRIARLEADVSHLRSDFADLKADFKAVRGDVGTLRVDVARLDERVKNLPGKGFVITATSTTIALIGGLILFADKLRALIAG